MTSTQPMTVGNPTFLVDRLGLDCAPLQFVRELTQNSIEAIRKRQATEPELIGTVQWDVDWQLLDEQGVYKLQIADNGCGMNERDIQLYVNSLSSSGGTQAYDANYGVGAKISAGKENPAGLAYKSWAGGDGILATLWKDPTVGYGLKQYHVGGEYSNCVAIPNRFKTTTIDTHGTSITLMGSAQTENTVSKPGLKQKWLIQYLNSRYYELPKNISVNVRDFNNSNPADWPTSTDTGMGPGGSQNREVVGMKYFLEKYSESFGTVQLEKATARWYLLPDQLNVSGGVWDEKSHVAAVFQSELYDVKRLREARAQLMQFGILFGANRVVLYIEPDTSQTVIVSNTARSTLLVPDGATGTRLPWADWASEFRTNIPAPIKQMMADILSRADTGTYADEIRRRLKEIGSLLQLSRYRRTPMGTSAASGVMAGGTARATLEAHRESRTNRGSRPNVGGTTEDLYAAVLDAAGDPATEIRRGDGVPELQWISLAEGTRGEEQCADRAAQYLSEEHKILANADFRGFTRLMEVLSSDYPHATPADIKRAVQSWTALQLTEAVIGIKSLKGSPEWSSTGVLDSALTEEALTAVVMSRYASLSQMKRELASRVGRSDQSQPTATATGANS